MQQKKCVIVTVRKIERAAKEKERKASRFDRRYDTIIHVDEIDDDDADD